MPRDVVENLVHYTLPVVCGIPCLLYSIASDSTTCPALSAMSGKAGNVPFVVVE